MPVDVDHLPAGQVRAGAERSLKELGVERLDLLQLHWWPTWAPNGYWMDELQQVQDRWPGDFT